MPNCPICETEYIEKQGHICVTCGFDLTPYPISLNGIPEVYLDRERGKLQWGQKLWSQMLKNELQASRNVERLEQELTSKQNQIGQLQQQNQELTANYQAAQAEIRKLQSQISQPKNIRTNSYEQAMEGVTQDLIELRVNIWVSLNRDILILQAQKNAITNDIQCLQSESKELTAKSPKPKNNLQTFRFETGQITSYDSRNVQIQRSQKEGKQFIHDLGNGVKLEMVEIPAGRFLMGAAKGEVDASSAEYPQHPVNVPSFFLSKYPITQAQYQQVIESHPSHFKGNLLPVDNVFWEEAQAFCVKLSERGHTYRLPSEAEWEYACRAGTTKPFYFGETITPELVNYDGNYPYGEAPKGEDRKKTTQVGSFFANGFGLFDMHGNVGEWCEDDWHEDYNGAPNDGSAWKTGGNPQYHVLRGGNWGSYGPYCRSAYRSKHEIYHYDTGFRVASSSFLRELS